LQVGSSVTDVPGLQPHPFCTEEASIHHSIAHETRRRGETVIMLHLASERRRHSTPTTSRHGSVGVSVVETTEIRWFVSGETLELETRLETGPVVELTDGLAGALESWRKWTPADGLVQRTATQRRIDVDKRIVKRRFSLDGAEVEALPDENERASCDVEVAAIRAGGTTAWSFAFAAHGPQRNRLGAIRVAWRALLAAGAPTIREVGLDRGESLGYPEWLGRR
jgi:hypothetical protein